MNTSNLLLPIIVVCSLLGCKKELFVTDISSKKVYMLSPADNAQIQSQTLNFVWDSVEHATRYTIQICEPSFEYMRLLHLDSTTSNTQIKITLSPGDYEWRVKALNDGYETEYTTYKISIDSTKNLSGFQLVISEPADSFFTNQSLPTFIWEPITIADEYNFKIVEGDNFEVGNLFTSIVKTNTSSYKLTKPLLNGIYTWGVNAENSTSKTPFASRFIWFDNIVPSKAILISPGNNQNITGKVTFSWQKSPDSGTPHLDSLFISTSNSFNPLVKSFQVYGDTLTDSLATGSYYWRMSTTDKAGNFGGYTTPNQFTIL
jgi:hypothetical protein